MRHSAQTDNRFANVPFTGLVFVISALVRAGYVRVAWMAVASAAVVSVFGSKWVGAEQYTVEFSTAPADHFLDRWMYPFNVTPGSRIQAPTFGALGSPQFDDRDGQFVLAVNTAGAGVPVAEPAGRYRIESLSVTLTETTGGYPFDSTYDRFATYLDADAALASPDLDAGRPLELYGVGFRNDFAEFGWPDGGPVTAAPVFSSSSPYGPVDRGTRNVFAADAFGQDISNHIDSLNGGQDGFDPVPFAVGQAYEPPDMNQTLPLSPGDEVLAGTTFVFEVNVADAAIQTYLQQSLASGQLGLAVTSVHTTGQLVEGGAYPNFATANHFAYAGPVLTFQVEIADTLKGDFDGDGMLSSTDIDSLTGEILNGNHDVLFDLNGDELVNAEDRRMWVEDLFGTYFGDSNLDGEFNSGDFVMVLQAGEYEDSPAGNSTWVTGDWDGNGEFNTGDLVFSLQSGGYELGPRAAVVGAARNSLATTAFASSTLNSSTSIPEPSSAILFTAGLLIARIRFRR
jgi:hypothetical protein